MKRLKRWLFLTHRWLGISLGLLFALWFVSGVVMMFVRMPILTPEERFERLSPVRIEQVRISPAQAWAKSGLEGAPKRMRLAQVLGRPAYLMLPKEGKWDVVFADDGDKLGEVSPQRAVEAASDFAPGKSAPKYLGTVREIDQWTLTNSLNLHRPLHRFAIDDAARTEIYVSQITGEVVMRSTQLERSLAWAGPILHWGAPEFLRKHVGPWRAALLWLSALGTLLALGGMIIGVMRWRRRKYLLKGQKPSHSPYRGWKKWHHVSGLVFGLVTLTWIWSGWLYLNPGSTRAKPLSTVTTFTPYNVGGVRSDTASKPGQSEAIKGGALDPSLFILPPTQAWRSSRIELPREIELARFAGRAYYVFYRDWNQSTLASASDSSPPRTRFELAEITAQAKLAVPNAQVTESEMLSEYDAFYYAVGNVAAKRLPIARVKFGDADGTWLYINPHDGSIFRRYDNHGRLMRWLINGLHCLDFPFLMFNGPLWHATVIVLSLGGLALTLSGLRMGVSRLRPERRAPKKAPQHATSTCSCGSAHHEHQDAPREREAAAR